MSWFEKIVIVLLAGILELLFYLETKITYTTYPLPYYL